MNSLVANPLNIVKYQCLRLEQKCGVSKGLLVYGIRKHIHIIDEQTKWNNKYRVMHH